MTAPAPGPVGSSNEDRVLEQALQEIDKAKDFIFNPDSPGPSGSPYTVHGENAEQVTVALLNANKILSRELPNADLGRASGNTRSTTITATNRSSRSTARLLLRPCARSPGSWNSTRDAERSIKGQSQDNKEAIDSAHDHLGSIQGLAEASALAAVASGESSQL